MARRTTRTPTKSPASKKLATYQEKRDFTKTPEPAGEPVSPSANAPIFVIHKHAARNLHYDFRLEIDGVLASWAVPKGPSLDPKDKRLAVHVEDHPFEYRTFEGTIPAGEYGGGTVMVWDFGTVRFKEKGKTPRQWLDAGHLEFELFGKKLAGGWVLLHTKMGGAEKNWLLFKRKDEFAREGGDILEEQPDSAQSGRTMDQIAASAPTSTKSFT